MATLAADFQHFIFSSVVRDLDVTLDQELTFAPHLNSLSRPCCYQLRTVAQSLTPTATATLIHSFVNSRLDYCSDLYLAYLNMQSSLVICATSCAGSPLDLRVAAIKST